jgi:hypothetical protein
MSFDTRVLVAHDPHGDQYVGRVGRVLYAHGHNVMVAFEGDTQAFAASDLEVIA